MIRLENVLKMSWRCLEDIFARRFEDVLKTSWKRLSKASCKNVLQKCFQDIFKTSSRCLVDVLKTFLQDVLKMSWRRFEDVWPRRIYLPWSRRLQDVLSTFSEDAWVMRIYLSWWRRLENVFWRRRRLHEDQCLLGNADLKKPEMHFWRFQYNSIYYGCLKRNNSSTSWKDYIWNFMKVTLRIYRLISGI